MDVSILSYVDDSFGIVLSSVHDKNCLILSSVHDKNCLILSSVHDKISSDIVRCIYESRFAKRSHF